MPEVPLGKGELGCGAVMEMEEDDFGVGEARRQRAALRTKYGKALRQRARTLGLSLERGGVGFGFYTSSEPGLTSIASFESLEEADDWLMEEERRYLESEDAL